MARTTRKITVSVPTRTAAQMDQVMKDEARAKRELVREALRHYMEERQWKQLFRYGELRMREQGIAPDDVEQFVDEVRAETR